MRFCVKFDQKLSVKELKMNICLKKILHKDLNQQFTESDLD